MTNFLLLLILATLNGIAVVPLIGNVLLGFGAVYLVALLLFIPYGMWLWLKDEIAAHRNHREEQRRLAQEAQAFWLAHEDLRRRADTAVAIWRQRPGTGI